MIRRCVVPGCPHLVRWAVACPAHRTSTTELQGGRFEVARHWQRWAVTDLSTNPPRVLRHFASIEEAEAFAARLNGSQSPPVVQGSGDAG